MSCPVPQIQPRKNPRAYKKQLPNYRAVVQILTWMQVVKIPARRIHAEDADLAVTKKNGGELKVKVAFTDTEVGPPDGVTVRAQQITNRYMVKALEAFSCITVAAGYGKLRPIDRGPDPEKKLSFEDNFELVAMRHKEFRKVPNLSAEALAGYNATINRAVRRSMYINKKIFARHGLEFSDLKTYAQIFTMNYDGLYRVDDPEENQKKLYAHLCQRFLNFIDVLLKKERNCIASSETASIAFLGMPYQKRNNREIKNYEDEMSGWLTALATGETDLESPPEDGIQDETDDLFEIDPDIDLKLGSAMVVEDQSTDSMAEATREEKARLAEKAKRRKEAKTILREKLGSLKHDDMVTLLADAMSSSFLCYDARAEARKQLRLHRKSCEKCQASAKVQK